MKNRMQISTDGLKAYVDAVETSFGADVDYAQIIRTYGHEEGSNNRRYSANEFVSSDKRVVVGAPKSIAFLPAILNGECYDPPSHAALDPSYLSLQ